MYRLMIALVFSILLWSHVGRASEFEHAFIEVVSMQSDDKVSIQQAFEQFLSAYAEEGVSDVMSFWAETSPDYAAQKKTVEEALQKHFYSFNNLLVSPMQIIGNKARFRVNMNWKEVDRQGRREREQQLVYNVEMMKMETGWKLWKYALANEDQQALAQALTEAGSEDSQNSLLANNRELISWELVRKIVILGRRSPDAARQLRIFKLAERVSGFVGGVAGKEALILALTRIGNFYFEEDSYALAFEYFRRTEQIAEEIHDELSIHLAKLNIGNVYYNQGNLSLALISYLGGLGFFEESKEEAAPKNYAQLLLQIGELCLLLDYDDLAVNCFERAQAKYHEVAQTEKFARDGKVGAVNVLFSLGNAQNKRRNYSEALESFDRGRRLCQELLEDPATSDQRSRGLVLAMLQMGAGDAYLSQGKPQNALRSFDEARQTCQKYSIGQSSTYIDVLLSIANTYDQQGNHEQALKESEAAISQSHHLGGKHPLYAAEMMKGRILNHANRAAEAREAFDEALKTASQISSSLTGDEQDQLRFFEDNAAPAIENASLLVGFKKYEEAFSYAEGAKARVLLDLLQKGRAPISKGMTPEERMKEKEYDLSIVKWNKKLYAKRQNKNAEGGMTEKKIEERLDEARLQLASFRKQLYRNHPAIQASRGENKPIPLTTTLELLPDQKTALIEFVVAEDRAAVLVVSRSPASSQKSPAVEIHGFPLDITRAALQQKIDLFHKMLEKGDGGFRPLSEELFNLLFREAQALLENKTSLVIIPDGPLWDLPFSALTTKSGAYLIEKVAVSYAPSLTCLHAMIKKRDQQKASSLRPLLAFGNPTINSELFPKKQSAARDETLSQQQFAITRGNSLSQLQYAAEEVKTIGKHCGARQDEILIGPRALEEKFKQRAAQYRILHLATHALLDNHDSMYSRIIMSQVGNKAGEDGLLEAREIFDLELNAEIAILSACQTARGRTRAGEGVIGLSWAFFAAGVPTIVGSQWEVTDNNSTKDLMNGFHVQMTRHPAQSKAESLRQAALKVMKTETHPHHWASFVLIGDGR